MGSHHTNKKRRKLPLVAISWILGLCTLVTCIFSFVILVVSMGDVDNEKSNRLMTNNRPRNSWFYTTRTNGGNTPDHGSIGSILPTNSWNVGERWNNPMGAYGVMKESKSGRDDNNYAKQNHQHEHEHEHEHQHNQHQINHQTLYNKPAHQDQPLKYQHSLPQWIVQYFKWHNDVRTLYPGNKIFTDPQAPKILIRMCHAHLCGGLHDRLGQLPLDLFLAARSNRILMIQWLKPYSLQKFLVPPTPPSTSIQHANQTQTATATATATGTGAHIVDYSIDWRMPEEWTMCRHLRDCIERFSKIPSLETNVGNGHVRGKNYTQMMDTNFYKLTKGDLKDEKIVKFEILGHGNEDWLEGHLRREGETDMIHYTPTFGNIFHSFFQLSPPIQTMYNHVTQSLNLTSQEYIAVHLRVRHPSGYRRNAKMDGRYAGNADRHVPQFANDFRESAIKAAIRALECTQLLKNGASASWSTATESSNSEFLPVYMMSDTKDLVNYFAFDLSNQMANNLYNQSFSENDPESIHFIAKSIASKFHIISRQLDDENLHIDKATPPGKLEQYYSVFLDLFIGINAKCMVFGIGNYAVFAAKISFTPCKIRYQRAKLGTQGIETAAGGGGGDGSFLSRDQICGKVKSSL
eukprot:CAMPEP_0176501060 /NCGR_PEP_ID=MMETSP0200_2-20121128/13945_1 /TAXON_ID=947934 /ORGANISM="Chaetoceros sp., Strain GSL56" /LENGTH=633 /DNA_ID=CAMNT_0017899893 /DNA_START=347 /DNA_END=2248 /DNA_ORIENTATION=-